MDCEITKNGGFFLESCGEMIDTYRVPVEILRPDEDISNKETPTEIDDYPILIYGDGTIQDGHHRYKYMLETGEKECTVILVADIDPDSDVSEEEWLPELYEVYWS